MKPNTKYCSLCSKEKTGKSRNRAMRGRTICYKHDLAARRPKKI